MWCPEGYITFGEIHAQLMWESDDLVPLATNRPIPTSGSFQIDTGTIDVHEARAFQNWATAGFLEVFQNDLRVCLASGNLVRLGVGLVTGLRRDPLGFNYEFHPFPTDYQQRRKLLDWEFIYLDLQFGSFRCMDLDSTLSHLNGLPICIKEAHLPVTVEKLPAWLWDEIPKLQQRDAPAPWSSRDDAVAIVQAFRAGKVRTKPEAKRMFGRNLPTPSWQALWEEAVALMPSLARPGRR